MRLLLGLVWVALVLGCGTAAPPDPGSGGGGNTSGGAGGVSDGGGGAGGLGAGGLGAGGLGAGGLGAGGLGAGGLGAGGLGGFGGMGGGGMGGGVTDCSSSTAVGFSAACHIKPDGTLWCWGTNYSGQLGDPAVTATPIPVQIGTANNWIQIRAGSVNFCGIRSDNTLWCWGRNYNGSLGVGHTNDVLVPTQLPGSWSDVSVGSFTSCGLQTNGSAWCWGANYHGELGIGATDFIDHVVPEPVVGGPVSWTAISAHSSISCGLAANGAMWCWGDMDLNSGPTSNIEPTPVQVSTATDWTKITAAAWTVCGLRGGQRYCWDTSGVVGQVPAMPTFSINDWVQTSSSCGIRSDGSAWCWGTNIHGNLGDGTTNDSSVPVEVVGSSNWCAASGGSVACGTDINGQVLCWGSKNSDVIGNGNTSAVEQLTAVTTSESFVDVAVGGVMTCAITGLGETWCFGGGALGNVSADKSHLPLLVAGGGGYTLLDTTGSSTCGLRGNGTLWCWGDVGISTVPSTSATPVNVSNGPFSDVDVGTGHKCVIRWDGKVFCWGNNGAGQLAADPVVVGTSKNYLYPAGNDTDWLDVSVGSNFTCATKTNGTLWCWGGTDCDGVPGSSHQITQVGSDSDWLEVRADTGHVCALKNDGSAHCCGANSFGQLGNGTTNTTSSWVPMAGNHSWASFSTGAYTSCGVRTDGSLWCSGRDYGSSPVQLGSSNGWLDVGVGIGHVCAIAMDGSLWCEGSSSTGQAGEYWIQPYPLPITL